MPHVLLYAVVTLVASCLTGRLVPPGLASFILSMWMPAIVAVVLVLVERRTFREALGLRFGRLPDHFIAVAIPTLVAAGTAAIGVATGHLTRDPSFSLSAGRAIPSLIFWIIAALGEEVGWRGYMHHGLRGRKHAPLLIGIVWATWHLPSLLQDPKCSAVGLAIFFVAVLQISYVFSWLADRSGSVLVCATMHGSWDFMRMQVLFGSATGKPGVFKTNAPLLTEMEGVFGTIVVLLVVLVVVKPWRGRAAPDAPTA